MATNFFQVENADLCALYEVTPSDEKTHLDLAKGYTSAYRSIHPTLAKGFFISKETIHEILAQDSKIDGLRIYGGVKNEGGLVYTSVIVATVPGAAIGTHDDFNVPKSGEIISLEAEPIIGEGRPCPYQCGADNELNKP
jgi:hypothetical protein